MKKLLIITKVLVVTLLLSSCDDYLDVNTDPNNPTSVTPDLVLPTGQNYTAQYIQGNRRANHLGNMLMYNWSETYGFSWYPDEFGYLVTSSFYSALFDDAYLRGMKQYQILTDLDTETNSNYVAIGMIMKAFHYQYLVDIYGDVPYTDALKRSENATPSYDNAQAIYDDLIVQLTDAIALIDAADGDAAQAVPGIDDTMFGGDMMAWKQFANTVKMRILVRESDVKDVSADIAAIVSEGSGFITSDVQINPGYLNEEGKQNPFWSAFGASVDGTVTLTNDATCATQWILDYLAANNDPRIDYIYELPATGHLGVDQGQLIDDNWSADYVSNIGPGIKSDATMSATIFTLAESNFNLAEAALKGLYSGDSPANLYNAGILASMNYLGVPGAAGAAYAGQRNFASAGGDLEAIITEKWIAMNGITALQSWFDYNRTGFPSGLPVSMDASTSDRPVRLMYPASEVTGNTANMPAQKNPFTDKIFWAN